MVVVMAVLMGGWMQAKGAEEPPAFRFKAEVLAQGMPRPMELEVAEDGRIFFNELGGKLNVYHPGSGQVTLAGEIAVFQEQENGFLGFALDPAFAVNHWIYLFYSPTHYSGSRLSRFEMRGDKLELASEKLILEFGEQRRECCHHAGSVEFGPDGNLYISTGDNTHPGGDSDGYAPIDERPGRDPYDAQKSSANTHDLRGKILRIRPVAEGGYTIPEGNLFPKDGSKGRPEIYVMGCRNPWRMSIDSRTGIVYWGEVGPDAGGDGPRGSRGYDEINQARRAGNFGWPYFVGNNFAYYDYDFAAKLLGAKFDRQAPTNSSPNNTGARVLPEAQAAFIYWPYGESKEFPMLGSGGRTACAGPVFHFKPEFKGTGGFPEYYDKCLLFYDWQRPFMKWARLDEESRLVGVESFSSAVTIVNDRDRANSARGEGAFVIQRPIDSQFGPDGCLYVLDYGETWGANRDSQLIKISYQWNNVAPVAVASAARTAGREPLTVTLSSAGSKDYEKDLLTFEWRLHPGGQVFSTNANPELKLSVPGNYIAELRVHDGKGGTASANVPLVVGNTPPQVRFVEPQDGDFFAPGQAIRYLVEATDAEDGSSRNDDEVMGSRTVVNAAWTAGGGTAQPNDPGLALMKQSDCFNCHAAEQKIVGPALLDIAGKYRDQEGALEASVQRVIHGSSGVWSEVPMLPHEGLNPDQVRMMVRWIFDLKPGQAGPAIQRGLTGELLPPTDEKLRRGLLEAVYTDGGRSPAGSLSAKASISLRSRRLEAELADEKQGPRALGRFAGAIDHGHALLWTNLNFQGSGLVLARVASGGAGGTIQLRAGSREGALLAELDVAVTGSWDKWIEVSAPLMAPAERSDLVVLFLNPEKSGLMNLDWIEIQREGEEKRGKSEVK